MKKLFFLFALLGCIHVFAQKDPIEGYWLNDSKEGKIQIYKATNGKFYGKIVWLKNPLNEQGKPKVDKHNKDPKHRNDPIMGMAILKGFNKDGDSYEDGTIYDPKNGKTYSCKMKLDGNNLDIRGYVGISLIGRTTTWSRSAE